MTSTSAVETTEVDVAAYVAEQVHLRMWRARLTTKELAEALGLSQSVTGKKVRGAVGITLPELMKIAQFLSVDPAELLPRLDSNQQPCVYTLPQVSAGVEATGGRVVRLDDWREERRIRTAVEAVAR